MSEEASAQRLRPLFEQPPDGLNEEWTHGALLVSLGTVQVMDRIEVARAFRSASERLLDAALTDRESWEALYPILYCYRHTAELYLKAIFPATAGNHRLDGLVDELRRHVGDRYRPAHVEQLCSRILELHQIDPSSTVFRYADGAGRAYERSNVPVPHPELWVDFHHLRREMGQVFDALEAVWLRRGSGAGS